MFFSIPFLQFIWSAKPTCSSDAIGDIHSYAFSPFAFDVFRETCFVIQCASWMFFCCIVFFLPPFLLSRALGWLIFLPLPFLSVCASLILILVGCGKYLYAIDPIHWWVSDERQNSNCFCPTDVSKYQSPEGRKLACLQITLQRPRSNSFSKEGKKIKTK